MLSPVYNSLGNRKTLPRIRLLVCLISSIVMVVFCQKDEDVYKREQKLQIDVAFIIHGSENITSPERKKTFKESLDWAKKIVKAFGEVGINKTRVALMLYAEEPKLMFNFTEKLKKDEVLGAIDEAASPPAIGNKTFTGKALWLAMKTLVNGTREEALKKFFVFSDRPPDDDPMSPALAMEKKKVDVYGLGQSTAPYSDWYISDYSLDTMYAVLTAGPFNGGNNPKIASVFQNQFSETTASTNRPAFSSTTKSNPQVVTTQPSRYAFNSASKVSEDKRPTLHVSRNTQSSGNSIAGVITAVEQPKDETLPKNNYGNDASVVITANSEKSGQSVGRYATGTGISYKPTDFGTVIGGKKLEGQTQTVIKPVDQNTGENSNVRSSVGSNRRRGYKWLKQLLKYA